VPLRQEEFRSIAHMTAGGGLARCQGDGDGDVPEPGKGGAARPPPVSHWITPAIRNAAAMARIRSDARPSPPRYWVGRGPG
jgi:hypothetical protein